jgi:hypothetical protein
VQLDIVHDKIDAFANVEVLQNKMRSIKELKVSCFKCTQVERLLLASARKPVTLRSLC